MLPNTLKTASTLSRLLTIAALLTDHFDYIKNLAGAEIIGFGGDYDGVTR